MSSRKRRAAVIGGLILAYVSGVGGNVLALIAHFAEGADDGGVATVFAVALPILGLISLLTLMIRESTRGLAPWWAWLVGIALNVLPFVVLIVLAGLLG
ncbi:MAG: hypothetical protein QNJ87_01670 [Gammaproteobacteria bacterium]|nr:hypothetical protein [Gammaproteobacteria bacterium]MDJ0870457.1 hypothetical protein [Gammaproteobacteria bacterium]